MITKGECNVMRKDPLIDFFRMFRFIAINRVLNYHFLFTTVFKWQHAAERNTGLSRRLHEGEVN